MLYVENNLQIGTHAGQEIGCLICALVIAIRHHGIERITRGSLEEALDHLQEARQALCLWCSDLQAALSNQEKYWYVAPPALRLNSGCPDTNGTYDHRPFQQIQLCVRVSSRQMNTTRVAAYWNLH